MVKPFRRAKLYRLCSIRARVHKSNHLIAPDLALLYVIWCAYCGWQRGASCLDEILCAQFLILLLWLYTCVQYEMRRSRYIYLPHISVYIFAFACAAAFDRRHKAAYSYYMASFRSARARFRFERFVYLLCAKDMYTKSMRSVIGATATRYRALFDLLYTIKAFGISNESRSFLYIFILHRYIWVYATPRY